MFWDDMAVIGGVTMKGRDVVIPETFQRLELEQVHVNCMGTEKTKLLSHKSIYRTDINNDIENHIKNYSICFGF